MTDNTTNADGALTVERALTVRQPWADLIVAGVKDVENRSWPVPSTLPQWWECYFCATRPNLRERKESRRHVHGSGPTPLYGTSFDVVGPAGPFPFTIAIHAAKAVDREAMDRFAYPTIGRPWAVGTVALGAFVGTVDVNGCHDFGDCLQYGETRGGCPHCQSYHTDWSGDDCDKAAGTDLPPMCSQWSQPDTYHWTLSNAVQLNTPIPAKGRQGLWIMDDDQLAAVGVAA